MSFKLQAAMASDEIKPRRFDLTMSRRTRRPPAATLATSCHEQDHHQAVDVEELEFQPVAVVVQQHDSDGLFCLSDHLQSRQPELDAHQEHERSEQCSEDTTKEQASPPQTCRLQKKGDENEAQQQPPEECHDNSRRFSLQELIEDEAVDAAAAGGTEDIDAAAAREVAEGATAEGEAKRSESDQVAGRRVMGFGIMRRYVKVRSIKPKRASPAGEEGYTCTLTTLKA